MLNEEHASDAFGSPHGSLAGLFRVALLFLVFSGGIAGAESGVPGIMLPELTQVTPEMIAKSTAACPGEPLVKPEKPRRILVLSC